MVGLKTAHLRSCRLKCRKHNDAENKEPLQQNGVGRGLRQCRHSDPLRGSLHHHREGGASRAPSDVRPCLDGVRLLLPDAAADPAHEGHRSGSRCRRHQSPAALVGSGLTTGLFWLLAGATGAIRPISRLATKPAVRGIMLGLELSFMVDGVHRMTSATKNPIST